MSTNSPLNLLTLTLLLYFLTTKTDTIQPTFWLSEKSHQDHFPFIYWQRIYPINSSSDFPATHQHQERLTAANLPTNLGMFGSGKETRASEENQSAHKENMHILQKQHWRSELMPGLELHSLITIYFVSSRVNSGNILHLKSKRQYAFFSCLRGLWIQSFFL